MDNLNYEKSFIDKQFEKYKNETLSLLNSYKNNDDDMLQKVINNTRNATTFSELVTALLYQIGDQTYEDLDYMCNKSFELLYMLDSIQKHYKNKEKF